MIGAITTDYETGLKVKDRINELEIVKHSEKICHIYGLHQVIFMYSNDEVRKKHESDMILRGWSKINKYEDEVTIYDNKYEKISLKAPCNIYGKNIKTVGLMDLD